MHWKSFAIGALTGAVAAGYFVGIGIASMMSNGILEIKGEE
jgi:hypothetical protein